MTRETPRQHPRYPARLAVEIKVHDWGDVLQLTTDNVSRGGLFVRTARPLAVGARISVKLTLPDGGVLTLGAEVAHVISPELAAASGQAPGFGLRFTEEHGVDLDLLEAMASAHGGAEAHRGEGDCVTVPARLVGADGDEELTTASRLVQQTARQVRAEQAAVEAGTYTIQIPSHAVIDVAPGRAVVLEVGEEGIQAHRSRGGAGARGERPPAADRAQDLDQDLPENEVEEFDGDLPEIEVDEPSADTGPPLAVLEFRRPAPRGRGGAADGPIYGIDFGTTYSSIALVLGSQIRIFEDAERITTFPSTVCIQDDGPLVGWAARERAVFNPSTTFKSPKRLIGRRRDAAQIAALLASSPVRTRPGPSGEVLAEIFGEPVSMPEICAEVFRHLMGVVARAGGDSVERVVLSAPTAFMEERAAIRRAAELAGLTVEWMQDEPVAAAMAFGLGKREQTIAVYDLGGGTFDFSLVQIAGGRFEMVGEAGDPWLGGDDFDLALADHAAEDFFRRHRVDLRQRPVEWQRLLMHCEAAKRRLSSEPTTRLVVGSLLLSVRGPINLELELTRDTAEALWRGLVARTVDAVDVCLSLTGVEAAGIGEVVMTGGGSRIPLVRRRVQELFGRAGAAGIDPEHAVVSGNAIQGRFVEIKQRHAARRTADKELT